METVRAKEIKEKIVRQIRHKHTSLSPPSLGLPRVGIGCTSSSRDLLLVLFFNHLWLNNLFFDKDLHLGGTRNIGFCGVGDLNGSRDGGTASVGRLTADNGSGWGDGVMLCLGNGPGGVFGFDFGNNYGRKRELLELERKSGQYGAGNNVRGTSDQAVEHASVTLNVQM